MQPIKSNSYFNDDLCEIKESLMAITLKMYYNVVLKAFSQLFYLLWCWYNKNITDLSITGWSVDRMKLNPQKVLFLLGL